MRSVLFLLSLLSVCFCLPYTKDSGVTILTKDNFAKEVFSTEHVWLVEFYAPWCGHCKQLAPEWQKAAKNLQGIIKVGAVNCDDHRDLCGNFGVQGFPTIKLFPHTLTQAKGGKGQHKVPIDYQGPRTAASLAQFALDKLPNFVTAVSSKNVASFLEGDLGKVILFTNKKQTTNLYKALAVDFHNALKLGEIRDSEKALVEQYEVNSFPTLIVLTSSGDKVVYEGELKHDALFKFLKPYAKQQTPQGGQGEQAATEEPATKAEPPRPVTEEVKDQETFDKLCAGGVNCFVTLLDPINYSEKEHQGHVAILEKVQNKLSKMFRFVWFNGVNQMHWVDKLGVSSAFPSSFVYNAKKKSIVPYIGSFDEASIKEFLEKVLRGAKKASPIQGDLPTILPVEDIPLPVEDKDEL